MRHEMVGGKEGLRELHGSSPASEVSAKHLEENLVRRWDRLLLKAPVDCKKRQDGGNKLSACPLLNPATGNSDSVVPCVLNSGVILLLGRSECCHLFDRVAPYMIDRIDKMTWMADAAGIVDE
jgi:hypothetical protein